MNSPQIIEEMKRQSERCQLVTEKEKNQQDAKEWLLKSSVWIEAETVVREMVDSPDAKGVDLNFLRENATTLFNQNGLFSFCATM